MSDARQEMVRLDLAPQRAMFGVEFVDPIRAAAVTEGLRVAAEGLRPPTVTPSGRFIWLDRGPPAERRIRLRAHSVRHLFAPIETLLDVPAHYPGTAAASLLFRLNLIPTGLYEPPVGMSAVGGMLVEGDGSREPVAGASIQIRFAYAEGMEIFTVEDAGRTDPRGGFIAVLRGLDDVTPDPDPKSPRFFQAELRLTRDGEVRVSEPLSLRLGRLIRIPAPLEWAALHRPDPDEDEFLQQPIHDFGR
jgi:hypothetical protein